MPSALFFCPEILMESRRYCAEHFNYNTDFRWYPKHTRLAFVCNSFWESTPILLSRIAKLFPVTESDAFGTAVAFYVQAKRPENERNYYNKADTQFCKSC